MIKNLLFLFISVPFILSFKGNPKSADIVINAKTFKSDNGKARAALYKNEKGFPSDPREAFMLAENTIKNGKSKITFKNVPFGEYAFSVLHDENLNSRMDTNFLGIPNEGYGVSNNAPGHFGPPHFKDAKFTFNKESLTSGSLILNIKIKY